MGAIEKFEPAFVVKAEELLAINFLTPDHPKPRRMEWINRGTNQILRPTTTQMLLRTLFQPVETPSIQKLRETSGLRIVFRSEREREHFAAAFEKARSREQERKNHAVTAIFEQKEKADDAVESLDKAGVPKEAISVLWRASRFMDTDTKWPDGHSALSITGAVAGSGFAGALLGVAILVVPGVGPVAAAGAIAGSAIASVASVSGIIGATGGAIAKMLTDHDVDGVSAAYYDAQIQRGKTFVSVDVAQAEGLEETARELLAEHGGTTADDV